MLGGVPVRLSPGIACPPVWLPALLVLVTIVKTAEHRESPTQSAWPCLQQAMFTIQADLTVKPSHAMLESCCTCADIVLVSSLAGMLRLEQVECCSAVAPLSMRSRADFDFTSFDFEFPISLSLTLALALALILTLTLTEHDQRLVLAAVAAGSEQRWVPVLAGSRAVCERGLPATVQAGEGPLGGGVEGGSHAPHPVGSRAARHAGGCSGRQ